MNNDTTNELKESVEANLLTAMDAISSAVFTIVQLLDGAGYARTKYAVKRKI